MQLNIYMLKNKISILKHSNYDLADAVYHEMDSHIENTTGNEKQDHEKFGTDGFKLISPTEQGSNSEKIVKISDKLYVIMVFRNEKVDKKYIFTKNKRA